MEDQDSILNKIENGIYTLSRKHKRKSGIWDIFAEIKKDDGSIAKGYLCCFKCSRLFKFDGRSISNFRRHTCFRKISQGMSLPDKDPLLHEHASIEYEHEDKDVLNILPDAAQPNESYSEQSLFSQSESNNNKISPPHNDGPKTGPMHTEQLNSLCDMIKVDLQDVPDEVFFEAKWKIMDILRDVHRKRLECERQTYSRYYNFKQSSQAAPISSNSFAGHSYDQQTY
ncbi:uncharacterized protein LOC101458204 [Ceratitis capitata]|uniref:uncharacterized protein LOC101458204 n=1 Tax=Ceratitis capitata TaxID=7213 RepID=UPI0006188AB3|nr:uncharacterized protein LOC101458204 [Ceratitis capitata]